MSRKKKYVRIRIGLICERIAHWELTGRNDEAQGLRSFFSNTIDESLIERAKKEMAIANPELAKNYTPKKIITLPTRKTGIYLEKKTLTRNEKKYEYNYWNVYKDGQRKKTCRDRDKAEAYAEETGISKYF